MAQTSHANAPRKRLPPDERRRALLDVAEDLLRDGGTARLTFDRIAEVAGVTQPLLSHYFAGRDDLLEALLERAYVRFDGEIKDRVAEEVTFLAKLRLLVREALDPSPSFAFVELVQSALAKPQPIRATSDGQAFTVGMFVTAMLVDEYGFDTQHAVVVAGTALASTQGFKVTWRVTDWTVEEAVDVLLELVLAQFARAHELLEAPPAPDK